MTRPSASTQNLCLHQHFAAHAADTPDRVALRFGSDTLTYAELNRRANRLAHHLRSLGVAPDTLVGISCQRSPESIVAILGVLKAGGAYVPLDPDHPAERLQFLIEDSGLEILVASPELEAALPAGGPRRVLLTQQLLEEGPDDDLVSGVEPSNLAYVIYTSGSTGKPKGVLIEHRNVTRLFSETRHWYAFDENDSWTLFHSIGFDFSVWEIWGALLHGGCLVGVSRELTRDPGAFLAFLASEGVTMLSQTPSAFRQLIEADGRMGTPLPLALRWVVFGGEALDVDMLGPWFERRGDSPRLANMYGITETTVHVTYREIAPGDSAEPGRSPIGVPIPDLSVHLLDPHGDPVPVGTPGEMCVGGGGVARGYLNRPELTAERFAPAPAAPGGGGRLYRSGDLAVAGSDGALSYLGRIDHQVKVRGYRIEPGEIESCLRGHELVSDIVVLARAGNDGANRLHAYVASGGEADSLEAELRDLAHTSLPDYMWPTWFSVLPKLPQTLNGKVDRDALLALGTTQRAAVESQDTAPPMIRDLLALYEEVLEVQGVKPADDFFDLGGDSLSVVQLFTLIEEQFGVALELEVLAQGASPEEVAAAVQTAQSEAA